MQARILAFGLSLAGGGSSAFAWDSLLTTGHAHVQRFRGDSLWIGTEGGLLVYDLNRKTFSHFHSGNSSLSANSVRQIRMGRDGSVWLLAGKRLFRMAGGTFTDQGAEGFDFALYRDTIPVILKDTLAYRLGGQWRQVPEATLHAVTFEARVEVAGDMVWMVGSSIACDLVYSGWLAIDGRSWSVIGRGVPGQFFPPSYGRSYEIAPSPDGRLWRLSDGKILRFTPDRAFVDTIDIGDRKALAIFPSSDSTPLFLTSQGELIGAGTPRPLGHPGLDTSGGYGFPVATGDLDARGSTRMALGLNRRIRFTSGSGWAGLPALHPGKPDTRTTAWAFAPTGAVWMAAERRGVFRHEAGVWTDFSADSAGPGLAYVGQMIAGPGGEIVVSTGNRIHYYANGSWRASPPGFLGILEPSIRLSEVDRAGNLWITSSGMNTTGLYVCPRKAGSGWPWDSPELIPQPGSSQSAYYPIADPENGVWEWQGKARWRNGSWDTTGNIFTRFWRNSRYQLFAYSDGKIFRREREEWKLAAIMPVPPGGKPHHPSLFDGPDGTFWELESRSEGPFGFCGGSYVELGLKPVSGANLLGPVPMPQGFLDKFAFAEDGTLWIANDFGVIWGKPSTAPLRPGPRHPRLSPRAGLPVGTDLLGRRDKGWIGTLRRRLGI